MEEIKIKIANKQYNVLVAESDEEKSEGLQNLSELGENDGMLFIFDEEEGDNEISMWMKDVEIPLDIVFINKDLEVISVHQGVPGNEDYITEENVAFVLEVNVNSEISKGDDLEFISNKDIKKKMLVLDENGESQMELDGGERIFSRPNTKILIKFAKKASLTNNDNDYITLGKRVFKFLKIQSETAPEFVNK